MATPSFDFATQLDIVLRLVISALLGGLIGLDRELHEHPAGLRTHLLVSLGSAAFTVLSITGFPAPPGPTGIPPTDPARIAAQIVSGIGFLGAGAILKYGTTIKGLTTAASLWSTAAVGMAAGAGAWLVAGATTAIIVITLWPLHAAMARMRLRGGDRLQLRLGLEQLEALAQITGELSHRRIEIVDIHTGRIDRGYEVALVLRLPHGAVPAEVISSFGKVAGVEILDASRTGE